MTEAQTATVSDEAVQTVIRVRRMLATGINIQATGEVTNNLVTGILTSLLAHIDALSSAPCSVEVEQLKWSQKAPGLHEHEPFVYWAAGIGGYYRAERDGTLWMAHDEFIFENHISQKAAKAAAQADFDRRILSQIVTKPVEVAAVRDAAFREGLEVAAHYHNHEAEYYEARYGDKDGVPFPIVAGWHRLDAQRIRALSLAGRTMEGGE